MSGSIFKTSGTGAAAIALSATAPAGFPRVLVQVSCHFDAAPVTDGSITVTLNANAGAAYDTVLASASLLGVTDYLFQPDQPLYLEGGDAVDVAYANADLRTYGAQITLAAASGREVLG